LGKQAIVFLEPHGGECGGPADISWDWVWGVSAQGLKIGWCSLGVLRHPQGGSLVIGQNSLSPTLPRVAASKTC